MLLCGFDLLRKIAPACTHFPSVLAILNTYLVVFNLCSDCHFSMQGMDRKRIRRHLLVFAAAAPVMAFLTFFGLGQVSEFIEIIFVCQ